jgi:hypothetical protein
VPAVVVLRASWYPGMTAQVDGQSVPTLPVTPFFAAVLVGPGDHRVHFQYVSAPRWPYWLLGVLGVAALPLGARWAVRLVAGIPRFSLPPLPLAARTPALALGVALLAGLPLLHGQELAGHDAIEYVTQLSEFHHVLMRGEIPPLWAPDFVGGGGSAFFGFFPPLLLAVAELPHLLGIGLVWSLNLATLALFATAVLLVCLYARSQWGEGAGLVAAAAFAFAPYVLLDLYVRHAFLEVAAFAWMPLVLWGVAAGRVLRVAAGSALLVLSHPALVPFFAPGVLLYAIACRTLVPAAVGGVLGLGLAAWNFVPASLERGALKLDSVIHGGYLDYHNHFAYFDQLLWSPWGFGISVLGHGDGMSFRIGPLHLVAALAGLIAFRRQAAVWALAAMGAIAAVFSTETSAPIWAAVPLLHAVQFPWRALAVTGLAVSLLAGIGLRRHPRFWAAVFVVSGLYLAAPSGYLTNLDERDYTPVHIAHDNLQPGTAGIFDPKNAPLDGYVPRSADVVEGSGVVEQVAWGNDSAEVRVNASTPGKLLLSINDFPGWSATVDGRAVPIRESGGRISVPFPAGHSTVALRFGPTALRRACEITSLLVALGILVFLCRRWFRSSSQESLAGIRASALRQDPTAMRDGPTAR